MRRPWKTAATAAPVDRFVIRRLRRFDMEKRFCDLCGKPAMDPAFTHLTFKRKIFNRHGYHLTAEFTEATKYYPTTRDERRDCCATCMAEGLETIARNLRATVEQPEDVAV